MNTKVEFSDSHKGFIAFRDGSALRKRNGAWKVFKTQKAAELALKVRTHSQRRFTMYEV